MLVANTGSNARDFCMLERNLLSHVKLALLLFLVSCSLLLKTGLVDEGNDPVGNSMIGLPLASLQIGAAILALLGGGWEYVNGGRDLIGMRAFMAWKKPHLALLGVVVGVVITTCIILLVEEF